MKTIKKMLYFIPYLIILFLIIYIIITTTNLNEQSSNSIVLDSNIERKEDSPLEKVTVDIKGAIQNPGVYQVDSNLSVNDVINLAGGLLKDADTSIINLAKTVTSEMVIIIYTKEEVKNSNVIRTVIKEIDKKCVCPNIENDGCLNKEVNDTIGDNGLININTANITELQTISGIGESKARSIIEYRDKNGQYKTTEDLKNVEGIGEKIYEQIKIYITT